MNIGFQIAVQQRAEWCIFHDIDLFPTDEIWELYSQFPHYPIHIGKMFARYNQNPEYFGGVVAMSELHFRAINGFPNSIFGWGGEDECFLFRLKVYGLYDNQRDPAMKFRMKPGSSKLLHDAEGYSTFEKKKTALDDSNERCMIKFELKRRETKANTFLIDGVSSLAYTLEKETNYRTIGDKQNAMPVIHLYVNIAQNFFVPYDCSNGSANATIVDNTEMEFQEQEMSYPSREQESEAVPFLPLFDSSSCSASTFEDSLPPAPPSQTDPSWNL